MFMNDCHVRSHHTHTNTPNPPLAFTLTAPSAPMCAPLTPLQGAILRSDVAGEVQMKCLLSGMPGSTPLHTPKISTQFVF